MPAERRFEWVVIGSGFGGSVVAHRLAAERREVLVLERGRPYPPGSFARSPRALREGFWDPEQQRYGLFDVRAFDHLDVLVASGLGGGSLIYANVMLRKDERTFVREDLLNGGFENWPVSREELDPHYDAVERIQQPQRFPLDAGEPYATTPKTRAMLAAAEELRLPAQLPPLAVMFAPDQASEPVPGAPVGAPADNLHGRPRSTCHLCGECDIGCNFGAKNTLDFTYLTHAHRAGAEIRTGCEVHTLAREGGLFRIAYTQHLRALEGQPAHLLDTVAEPERVVLADNVVLAAGAIGTPELLLKNRAGLPRLSPALGHRVSANGDYLGWIRDCRHPEPSENGEPRWRYLDPSVGPVITASIKVDGERSPSGRGFLIQDGGAPSSADWLWEPVELTRNAWRARGVLFRRLVQRLRGHRDTNASDIVVRLLGDAHASAAMMPVLGMGRDIPNGAYRLEGDQLELDFSVDPSADYYKGLGESVEQLARALGGRAWRGPLARRHRGVSAHPVGGCPMSDDPRQGVVDAWGRVYGQPGLWVADGSVMPGPVGENPSFTIAALADRFAYAMLEPQRAPEP
jgi:cholesterol oxidase